MAWEKLGGVQYALGQYDKAFESFSRAIKLNPSVAATSYAGRGMIFAHRGASKSAIQDYTMALKINPSSSDVLNNRATARMPGDLPGAISDYSEALRLNPNQT